MTFETIKSFILGLLVATSILLTFSLWTYQPQSNKLYNNSLVSEEEMDVKGIKQSRKDIVSPLDMVFHHDDNVYGFSDVSQQLDLYRDMQSWVLYDFGIRQKGKVPNKGHVVELIFPDAMPMQVLNNLLTFNEDPMLPEWSFQHMYITFSKDESRLNLMFESVDGEESAQATVNNSQKYEKLWDYATTSKNLQPYMKVETEQNYFYMPKDSIKLYNWRLTTNATDPNKLVNALFNNPGLVKRNMSNNEANYTDGTQGMRVDKNKLSMEFYNPYDSPNYELMSSEEVLEQSTMNINEHQGWTDDYRFWSFKQLENQVDYRMFYDDYPVFNTRGYAQIKQTWRGNELYEYRRPLFKINNEIGGTKEVLPSGEDVIDAIETNRYVNYDMDSISDIMPGYKLVQGDDASYVMTLVPTWFMEYNGEWVEIVMGTDDSPSDKRGTEDAMDAD